MREKRLGGGLGPSKKKKKRSVRFPGRRGASSNAPTASAISSRRCAVPPPCPLPSTHRVHQDRLGGRRPDTVNVLQRKLNLLGVGDFHAGHTGGDDLEGAAADRARGSGGTALCVWVGWACV